MVVGLATKQKLSSPLWAEEWTNFVTSNQFRGSDYTECDSVKLQLLKTLSYHVSFILSIHGEPCRAVWLSPLIERCPAGCPPCSGRYEYSNFHPKLSCFVAGLSFPMGVKDKEL